MILIDREIEYYALNHKMVFPFDRELLNPASLDIRVGSNLKIATDHGWVGMVLDDTTQSEPFLLHPNEFILVESLEVFNFPSDICGMFKLKSSSGRKGFDHGEAGFIDPNWKNSRLTMELKNIHPYKSLRMYKGLRIGQIVFMRTSGIPTLDYSAIGHYNNDLTVKEAKY